MKYFVAVVVLAACVYGQKSESTDDARPQRAAVGVYPGAYPAAYVPGAPVAYAAHPAAYAAHPAAYAPVAYAQPAYKPVQYVAPAAHPAYVAGAPHAYAAPVAYAAQPAYYTAGVKTVHV